LDQNESKVNISEIKERHPDPSSNADDNKLSREIRTFFGLSIPANLQDKADFVGHSVSELSTFTRKIRRPIRNSYKTVPQRYQRTSRRNHKLHAPWLLKTSTRKSSHSKLFNLILNSTRQYQQNQNEVCHRSISTIHKNGSTTSRKVQKFYDFGKSVTESSKLMPYMNHGMSFPQISNIEYEMTRRQLLKVRRCESDLTSSHLSRKGSSSYIRFAYSLDQQSNTGRLDESMTATDIEYDEHQFQTMVDRSDCAIANATIQSTLADDKNDENTMQYFELVSVLKFVHEDIIKCWNAYVDTTTHDFLINKQFCQVFQLFYLLFEKINRSFRAFYSDVYSNVLLHQNHLKTIVVQIDKLVHEFEELCDIPLMFITFADNFVVDAFCPYTHSIKVMDLNAMYEGFNVCKESGDKMLTEIQEYSIDAILPNNNLDDWKYIDRNSKRLCECILRMLCQLSMMQRTFSDYISIVYNLFTADENVIDISDKLCEMWKRWNMIYKDISSGGLSPSTGEEFDESNTSDIHIAHQTIQECVQSNYGLQSLDKVSRCIKAIRVAYPNEYGGINGLDKYLIFLSICYMYQQGVNSNYPTIALLDSQTIRFAVDDADHQSQIYISAESDNPSYLDEYINITSNSQHSKSGHCHLLKSNSISNKSANVYTSASTSPTKRQIYKQRKFFEQVRKAQADLQEKIAQPSIVLYTSSSSSSSVTPATSKSDGEFLYENPTK
ncbi:hypothetical protein GJ496_010545, partial [Pomphorhynchus laevis]